ncbi:hypothetical protein DOTSEDRAFT_130966, partial [Dothistroma septosporum NZE10]
VLAYSFAKAGCPTVMPDLFHGDPVPASALSDPSSSFNMTAWRARPPHARVAVIITSAIRSRRGALEAKRLAAAGYCFGGNSIARFLAERRGVDAGFTAQLSAVLAEEWEAVAGPISIACSSTMPRNRTNAESIFFEGNEIYQTSLFANAEHGFAVRTNLTDKKKAFAQGSAHFQAVR